MMDLMKGLRFTFRGMARRPMFSAIVILTLALGLGVNAAIFSFVSAILLEPLPYPDADRLMRIESIRGEESGVLSMQEIEDFRDNLELFEGVAGHTLGAAYNLSGGDGPPENLPALLTTANLFEVLGVPMQIGGSWPTAYDRERNYSVVLSHKVWKQQFEADPEILDRTLTLDAAPLYEVFGVLPQGFDYPVGTALFRSAAFKDISEQGRNDRYYLGLARLRPGVTQDQAQEELDAFAHYLATTYPDTNEGLSYRLTPLKEIFTGAVRPYLLLLFGAAGLVLAVVCCNVVSLLLARGMEREKELATRVALGAERGFLVRLQVIEALVFAGIGAGLGLLGASFFIQLLTRFIPVQLPVWMNITIDSEVLGFTVLVTLGVGAVAGFWPAWRVTRNDLGGYLKQGGRGSSAGQGRVQKALVIAEVALAVVLSIGAGLMLQSFDRLQSVDLGYHSDDVLTYRVALSWRAYRRAESNTFYEPLLERIEALPGVVGVATNHNLPMTNQERPLGVTLEGQNRVEQQGNPYIQLNRVSPKYFEVLEIPLLEGRLFDPALDPQRFDEEPEALRAAIVSQGLAQRLWPGAEPLGQRLKLGEVDSEAPWLTVVGVVGDVLQNSLTQEARADLYLSTG